MKKALLGGLFALLSITTAYADIVPPTCEQFKAGYDALSSRSFAANEQSFQFAADAIANNHLLFRDTTQTAYATREQIVQYLKSLAAMDALIWLQSRYTDIELQLQRCSGPAFEQKRLILIAPGYAPKPNRNECGGPMPDLSKPLAK